MRLCFVSQLFVEVRDGSSTSYVNGRPYLSSFGTLNVVVQRNAGPPVFVPAQYQAGVNEDFPTGTDLTIITLVDPDGDVSVAFVFIFCLASYTMIKFITIKNCYAR